MKSVSLLEAKAGQRVAKDVLDSKGNLLLKAGSILVGEHLERLKERGVEVLVVEDPLSPEELQRQGVAIDREVDEMFSEVIVNPLMGHLRESVKRYLKQNLGG